MSSFSVPAPARPPLADHLAVSFAHDERDELLVLAGVTAAGVPADIETFARAVLAPAELAYHRRVPAEKRRREYLLGRYAAKSAVAARLARGAPAHRAGDCDALAAIEVRPGAFQQPVVELPEAGSVGVTLAHSGAAAFALAHDPGHPVGIDLELHDPAHLGVLRSQVSPAELPPSAPGHETDSLRHTLAWAAKEALSKALRCGLTCPFEILALDRPRLHPGGWCAGGFVNFGQYQFAAWVAADHAFALVCAKHARIEPVLPALVGFTRRVLAIRASEGAPA